MDLAKTIDGKKFMWDGRVYQTEKEAETVKSAYEQNGFEVWIIAEEEKYLVYNRRIVKEIVVEGQ